jgi:hypothetical protein
MIAYENRPLVAFDLAAVALDAGGCPRPGAPARRGASIYIRPRGEGLVEHREHPGVPQRPPHNVPCGRTLPQPIRDLQAVGSQVLPPGSGRLRGGTHREDLADRGLDFLIGIEDDLACSLID